MIGIKLAATIYILLALIISSCARTKNEDSQTHVIQIKQMSFSPKKLVVNPGDSVRWINQDLAIHNVKSLQWESPKLEQGESFTVEVTGETEYKCTFHPTMKGTLEVKNRN